MFTTFLKKVVLFFEPEHIFPTVKLNYHKAVDAIMSQSDNGRKSFYGILLTKITEDDKKIILEILCKDDNTRKKRTKQRAATPVRVFGQD